MRKCTSNFLKYTTSFECNPKSCKSIRRRTVGVSLKYLLCRISFPICEGKLGTVDPSTNFRKRLSTTEIRTNSESVSYSLFKYPTVGVSFLFPTIRSNPFRWKTCKYSIRKNETRECAVFNAYRDPLIALDTLRASTCSEKFLQPHLWLPCPMQIQLLRFWTNSMGRSFLANHQKQPISLENMQV